MTLFWEKIIKVEKTILYNKYHIKNIKKFPFNKSLLTVSHWTDHITTHLLVVYYKKINLKSNNKNQTFQFKLNIL